MRTKKVSNTRFASKLDKIFWFFISLAPLILYALYLVSHFKQAEYFSFYVFISNYLGLFLSSSSVFSSVFSKIVGPSGIFPLFSAQSGWLVFFSYLATVEIVHALFDVVVFIPRLAHKWISKAVQDD